MCGSRQSWEPIESRITKNEETIFYTSTDDIVVCGHTESAEDGFCPLGKSITIKARIQPNVSMIRIGIIGIEVNETAL